jgi:hypothetical protein
MIGALCSALTVSLFGRGMVALDFQSGERLRPQSNCPPKPFGACPRVFRPKNTPCYRTKMACRSSRLRAAEAVLGHPPLPSGQTLRSTVLRRLRLHRNSGSDLLQVANDDPVRRGAARASWESYTTPTRSANMPTTGSRISTLHRNLPCSSTVACFPGLRDVDPSRTELRQELGQHELAMSACQAAARL